MQKTSEHLLSYNISKTLWQNQISSLGIDTTLEWHGVGEYKTAICYLIKNGKQVTKGIGKGLTLEQVELSACYEALENYLSSYDLFQREIIFDSIDTICNKYQSIVFRCQSTFFTNKSICLPWILATELQNKKHFAIPLATVDTTYNTSVFPNDEMPYAENICYASTNGLSCSSSYEGALIHSISEIIERDAISYFLLDTFLLQEPIQVINKKSLPLYLQELIFKLETQYCDEIILIHIPSRHHVPTFCAVFTQQNTTIPPKGFGTSLNASYAAERAILEALQTLHVYECFPEECIDINKSKIKDFPVLLKCVNFNIMALIQAHNYIGIDFVGTSKDLQKLSKQSDMQMLINKIYQNKQFILIDNVLGTNEGISCLNVIIPEMEEFFHLFNNVILIPQEHTMNYVKHKQKVT